MHWIKVITKLPNSEQSYKGKVKTHNYINRQSQSTTGKLWNNSSLGHVAPFEHTWCEKSIIRMLLMWSDVENKTNKCISTKLQY